MSKQFAGLCIGGPYAGKQIVTTSGTFKITERLPARAVLAALEGKASQAPVAVKEHIYHSHMIRTVGLWIHHSLTLDEAIQEIAAGYIQACKQADPRVIPTFRR